MTGVLPALLFSYSCVNFPHAALFKIVQGKPYGLCLFRQLGGRAGLRIFLDHPRGLLGALEIAGKHAFRSPPAHFLGSIYICERVAMRVAAFEQAKRTRVAFHVLKRMPQRFHLHRNGLVKGKKTEIFLDDTERFAQPVEVYVQDPENRLCGVIWFRQ